MKITDKKMENTQTVMTIEMEPAEIEVALEKAYRKLVKEVKIPGFRKGKATRQVFEQHVGRDALMEEALNDLLPNACEDAIKQEGIEAFARPTVEITQQEPVVFTATVPLPPVVELGDYKKLRVQKNPVNIKAAEVDAVINQLRHQQATHEPVKRPVKFTDLVAIDVEGKVDTDTIIIKQKEAQFPVQTGSNYPAPGFAEELVGLKKGEEKEFKLTFPKDYGREDLAGKEATFKVKVTEVKEEKLPELDDAFVKSISSELTTVAALKKHAKETLQKRAEEKADQEHENDVIKAVSDISKVEYPPVLVEIEVENLIRQQVTRWQHTCRSEEEFKAVLERNPVEEMRKNFEPMANDRLVWSLVLGKVAAVEDIQVTDEDVERNIDQNLEGDDKTKAEQKKRVNTPETRQQIRNMLVTRATIDKLKELTGKPVASAKKKASGKTAGKASEKPVKKPVKKMAKEATKKEEK